MNMKLPCKGCTGCAACSNVCPKDAISMELDENGFYKPVVDSELCVECGLCEKKCPVNNPEYENINKPVTFAYGAEDEVRARSSSGGVFEELAKHVLDNNGVVCGVAYKDDFTTQHIMIENVDELYKLRGSKYVMSDVGDIYRQVKEQLINNRKVLFTGVPCQVAGLNAYLGEYKNNENLISVDLICHGIPSVKAFKKYIADLHSHKEIKYIGYKEKEYGWHASMTIDFADGDRYNMPCEKDSYFWSYLSGVNKNECCGNCKFAKIPRQGDITIGDYWGISNYKKELNDTKGTSVVLLNTTKGERCFEEIKSKAKILEETPLEPAINGNSNLVSSPKTHVSRNQFFKNLSSRRFGELANWSYSAERYDVGLVGIPTYVNFGGALTYYALYNVLEANGLKTVMISRPRSCGRPPIMADMVYEKNPYPINALKLTLKDKQDMRSMNDICESFLVGSDQLFNADLYYKFGEMVTLDWVNDNHRKVAYAASFGHSVFWGKEDLRAKMAHDIQKFDAFSVREEDGVALAKREFGIDATHVLDPVFLCDKECYVELSINATRKNDNPHIFAYILDANDENNKILELCSKKKNLDVELFSEMLFKPTEKKLELEQEKFTFELRQAKIEERLYSLINSKFIVADSFHGICFAIIFEIPFVAILNKNRGATRFYTILKKMNLLDRLVTSVEEAKEVLQKDIDFTTSRQVIAEEKERCINWLLNSLVPKDEAKKPYSFDDIITQKFDAQKKQYRQNEIKMNALMNGRLFNTVSDIYQYLDMVRKYKNELVVAISVRDTPGFELNEKINSLLHDIGCQVSLVDKHWQSYVFMMDGDKVVSEVISKNQERVAYTGTLYGKSYKVVSRSYNRGDISAIQIDGIEYSENRRGLNIVLIDKNLNEVIDTVVFDTHEKNAPCYRNGRLCKTNLPASRNMVANVNNETKVESSVISKPEKKVENVENKNVPSGINKSNEILLHNAFAISAGGGCSLDYYVDKGIKEIAIYGTDLVVAFLWEQAYYAGIKVVKLLSDKARTLDVRLPRVGTIELEDLHSVNLKEINVPIIVAEVACPLELLALKKEGRSIYKFGDINLYSHGKRMLFDYVLEYKKQYPKMKIAFFDMPAVYQIENASEYELALRNKAAINLLDKRKKLFWDLGYSDKYIKEVMQRIMVTTKNNVDFCHDQEGEYVNVVNGYRVTTDVPVDFDNTIYMFGNSVCYGVGTDDEYTIASVLQREMLKEKGHNSYAVLNCSNGGGLNYKQQCDSFKYHMPQDGDIVVFVMTDAGELLKDVYEKHFIWVDGKEVLNRPHDLGEIFIDFNHVNAKGYEACGKLLARKLLENNLTENVSEMNEKTIAPQMSGMVLDDKQEAELQKYLETIAVFKKDEVAGTIGSIVMNCNPFTLGHRYLIETVSKKCDVLYIFVVEEDKSIFSFEDRIELVRRGTKDLSNVIVIPSGKFIISQLTFNAYFQKEENNDIEIDPTNDVQLFATRIAPTLGITKRFAGDEPLDKITNQYNSTMKRVLPRFGLEFEVIKRKEEGGEVISASRVRRLLQNKEFEKIQRIVPVTTYDYLYNKYKDSKRVLVLGGTRFMGIRLVEQMIEKNWFITLATRGVHKDSFGKNVTRVKLDRKNEQTIIEALEGKEFDYIFDNIAYTGNDVKRLLPHVKCSNYIQVSSVGVYNKHHLQLKEEELNSCQCAYNASDEEKNYGVAKRAAECVALQEFPEINTSIVRIPFVVEPENLDNKELNMRLFFYVEHIMKKKAMKVDNSDYTCSFVRTNEEAEFLMYLAQNNLKGVFNFSSQGGITIGEIIKYIEEKSGIKAIISDDGDNHPFRSEHFGYVGYDYDLINALSTGFEISELKEWIYALLDKYIQMFN